MRSNMPMSSAIVVPCEDAVVGRDLDERHGDALDVAVSSFGAERRVLVIEGRPSSSDRRRALLVAARSRHVGALRLREALADVLAGGGLAGVVVEPGVEAIGAFAVGHGAGDGGEVVVGIGHWRMVLRRLAG